jgi:signal transduction histidine kinase
MLPVAGIGGEFHTRCIVCIEAIHLTVGSSSFLKSVGSGESGVAITPGTRSSLASIEREHAAWLGDIELRVLTPIKYALFLLLALHWVWAREWNEPSVAAFGLFVFFLGLTAGAHYLFARDRVTPQQMRPFVIGLFILDAAFVTALVFLDMVEPPSVRSTLFGSYYLLFILVVLRGFGLFRTRAENTFGFALTSLLFFVAAWAEVRQATILDFPLRLRELALIWGVMLVAQAFVGLVNARKEEQARFRERLVRASSLASLGELSAGVAHEINNPIGIIKTYTDFLERSLKEEDPLREDIMTIRREAERCEQIVKRMLDFTNPKLQGLAPVDIAGLVGETVEFVFHTGRDGAARAVLKRPDRYPHVAGDAIQLRQALLNVLVNARQLVDDHCASQAIESSDVEVELTRGGGPRPPIRIEVRDRGPGIAPEDADRVFEPFFTRRAEGTGLGLAITRRIIEAHGGTIRLEPRPGGGAVVTIELPMEGEEER